MKHIVGSVELVSLPELSINTLHARVDTGAATSSLHVDALEECEKDGQPWVTFVLHPDLYHLEQEICCEAQVMDVRKVKSSNGVARQRFVIKTPLQIGDLQWDVHLTLTDRSDMSYLMLLGREAMIGRLIVDPSNTYLGAKQSLE